MNFQSQFKRELKSALIWALVPWAGLMSAVKVVWDWYLSGTIDIVRLIQLIGSVAVVLVCGYFTRKTHLQWQAQVLAGTTEIGEVMHVSATSAPKINVLGLIGAGVLFAILTLWRPVSIASLLIFFLTAMIWLAILSTVMIDAQCIIGTQGLCTAQLGWKIAVPYSAIKHVKGRVIPDERMWLTLHGPDIWFGGVLVPLPLDQPTLDILKNHISIDLPNETLV